MLVCNKQQTLRERMLCPGIQLCRAVALQGSDGGKQEVCSKAVEQLRNCTGSYTQSSQIALMSRNRSTSMLTWTQSESMSATYSHAPCVCCNCTLS